MKFKTSFILIIVILFAISGCGVFVAANSTGDTFFPSNHEYLRFTGRIEKSNPAWPRLYQPGIYLEAAFEGESCKIIVKDQQLWGENQNYLQIVLDGQSKRIQTKGSLDTIEIKCDIKKDIHHLLICKNTEANIGWIEIGGLICEQLVPLPPIPSRKIEFIGNSITCGASSDISGIPCGEGKWHDQHNAYMSYGPITARKLNASWHLSSVSGIGLIRSCCQMDILMPQVFDNIDMRGDSISWDFQLYQPDVVTVCLGQNDGIQDEDAFCDAYIKFLSSLRKVYPKAELICLTSPMASEELKRDMQKNLTRIIKTIRKNGDLKVDSYFFKGSYTNGCDYHPDLKDHDAISKELTPFIQAKMNW
ncbi:MAG: acetyl xylan esterase [Bacteroidetes bacterium]|nr:MAG: acetyl xylan esterase [Bacteroidota bacterium]